MDKKLKVKSEKLKVGNHEAEHLHQQVAELRSQLARALADYDNLRKRVDSEKRLMEGMAASRVVSWLLPVLDMLTDAQKHLKDAGIEIVIGEFKKSLYDLGVEEIKANVGDLFDPLEEEAVEMVAGGRENTIAEVVQTGWKIKDENFTSGTGKQPGFIIRPAKVKVNKVSN